MSSSNDGSASKRCKGKQGGVDDDNGNSTLYRRHDDDTVTSSSLEVVENFDCGVENEVLLVDYSYEEKNKCEKEEGKNEELDDGNNADEDLVDKSASAACGRKKSNTGPGKPTEAGIIKTIYCENFMCHRKLRVDLNRNVNFIHGQNGSGKFGWCDFIFSESKNIYPNKVNSQFLR